MEETFLLSGEMRREFESRDTIRHEQAKPPKDAYFYFPKEKEIIEFDVKNPTKTLRRIFEGGVEYNQYEKLKLRELSKEIEKINSKKKGKFSLPDGWKECNNLRFLQATQYNVTKTVEMLVNHIEWRKINLPVKVNDKSKEILNLGFIYIHGRDSRFRPVMNIVAHVYEKYKKKYSFNDWEKAVIYFMEYSIHNLLIPGQVENWDIICDLKDISITSIPEELKKILALLQNNYRCRLYVMYIINIGGWVSFGWTVIKKFLDASTERKIQLLKPTNQQDMFRFINPRQIEKKFGGLADDVKEYFFPPIFPNQNFLLASEKKEEILIEEDRYRHLIKGNKDIVPCPHLNKQESALQSEVVSRICSNRLIEKELEKGKLTFNY
jgi:hypothetical protein